MAEEQKFPTEVIDLPSEGKLYPKDSPLSDGKIEIKYMTAKEEDILTSANLIKKGLAVDTLLNSLIVDKDIILDDLILGDKNAVMVAARVLAYGPEYICDIKDPNTGDTITHTSNDMGYPVYDSARLPTFVLTNSSKGNESESLAFSLFKTYDNGWDIRLGYAWTDAKDVNPMTSSVAFSNYVNRTFYDPEEEVLSTSNYNIEHRFTGVFNYTANWFGEYRTRFSIYGQASSGVPYSTVLGGAAGTIGAYGFTPYLDFIEHVLEEPGTRNNNNGSWWRKVDMRISQEFPGFTDNHRGSAFVVIDNLTNLLNDDWGVMYQANFPYGVTQDDIDAGRAETRRGEPSLWEIRVGFNYRF